MISILIPTYNYNVFPLVKEAHHQGEKAGIPFEILVYDDCSPNPVGENENINGRETRSISTASRAVSSTYSMRKVFPWDHWQVYESLK